MSSSRDTDDNEPGDEADRQADAMKDQLRGEVASWAASRSGEAPDNTVRAAASAARQATSAEAPRAPRRKAKATEAAKPAEIKKQPFRMSYDGTTDKDYIAQRVKLGAR